MWIYLEDLEVELACDHGRPTTAINNQLAVLQSWHQSCILTGDRKTRAIELYPGPEPYHFALLRAHTAQG